MPQTSSVQAATDPESQQLSSSFDCSCTAQDRDDQPIALLLHELRTPIASIENAMAVLRLRGKDESLRQRMHELIERQVRQIALLTSSLCQISGPGMADLELLREKIDLRAVVGRAVESLAPEFIRRQNEVLVSLPQSSAWVFGDASRLEQVFVNLLSNASKYSETGGEIVVSMQTCDEQVVVQVRDFGVGIPADSMPFIFDLFVRADTAAVRMRPGLGIGLALVRSILDAHAGAVSAKSEGGGMGSEFTVRLKREV